MAVLSTVLRFNVDASCGSASCPLNSHRYLGEGFFRLSLSHEYINQDLVYVGSSRSYPGAIRYDHDEVQTINQRTVAQFQVGFSDRLAFTAEAPFVARQHSHILHDISRDRLESWNLNGLGDVVVSAQYALLVPRSERSPYLSIVGGVKLPTGLTHLKNGEGEEAEVTVQPGTGSTDGIAGLYFRQIVASVPMFSGKFSSLPVIAGLSYQLNGVGTNGWKFGNTLLAHVGTSYQFSANANFTFQMNGRFQGFADVGATGEPRENTGGTWIFASPGANIQLSEVFSAFGVFQIPIYQNVHGIQQTARVNLQFGISADLGLFD